MFRSLSNLATAASQRVTQLWYQRAFWVMCGPATATLVFGLRLLGTSQLIELAAFDQFLQLRPAESMDNRVVIVGIGEADLQQLGESVISDQNMAQLLKRIKAQNPRVIGLDFYRNLPVAPGNQALSEVFRATPNLIGITKVVNDGSVNSVEGNQILVEQGQVAASDAVVDLDGRVRRGILSLTKDGEPMAGLALRLALEYLGDMGIEPDPSVPVLQLQTVRYPEFQANDGGYVNADVGGYQILLNPRSVDGRFRQLSAIDVLTNNIPPNLLQDKVVLVGNTAPVNADIFFNSYSSALGANADPVYGVELHAHLISQIISAVIDQRPLIKVLPKWGEWLLMLLVATLAAWSIPRGSSSLHKGAFVLAQLLAVIAASYLLLMWGWWLPIVPALATIVATSGGMMVHESRQLKSLSELDELTQIANRRTFNERLEKEWTRSQQSKIPLSLILCDVDFFKIYNDTYGHPKGDECLRQVAKALKQGVNRSADLVARYGGEEFVVLMPNTDSQGALKIAQQIQAAMAALKLVHRGSKVSDFVTLSIGVSSLVPTTDALPESLINIADLGLYEAKGKGRDQVVVKLTS